MNRREFITLIGGAAGCLAPRGARSDARDRIPRLSVTRRDHRPAARISSGLKDTGHVEGENVSIVYRFAENQDDRPPELAAELVRQRVAAIATFGQISIGSTYTFKA